MMDRQSVFFLDCAREISGFRVTAVSSIVMSFLGLAAVLVLVIFFSQIVIPSGGGKHP